MKAYFVVTATLILVLSIGFFVSQNLSASSDLVALSDAEMIQHVGGATMAQLKKAGGSWENDIMSCSVEDCPRGTKKFYYAEYECVPCRPENTARTSHADHHEYTSWCLRTNHYKTGELIECEAKGRVTDWESNCKKVTGLCGSSS